LIAHSHAVKSPQLPSNEELSRCLATLEALHQLPPARLAGSAEVAKVLAAGYSLARRAGRSLRDPSWKRPTREDEQRASQRGPAQRFHRDDASLAPTSAELQAIERPPERERPSARRCYLCERAFRSEHGAHTCEECQRFSAQKRARVVDLRGRVALVTGARVRIGYAVCLSLLRAGATVHGTTRFAADARARFAAEPDAHAWSERLALHSLDLCDLRETERFAERFARERGALDLLVNNAARTVDHPPEWLEKMRSIERDALESGLASTARALSMSLDELGQPLDDRPANAWRARVGEVALRELLAVHAINALAPFVLLDRLRAVMTPRDQTPRFVVNVTSPEGRFYRRYKGPWHPHTNMAKAALDMMTRTCADELALEGLYLTSVDPGWVSEQHGPSQQRALGRGAERFVPPVSPEDAAARVLDPMLSALSGAPPVWGVVLRNFRPVAW
jgi:NAD(P)-dependent dehydrogenase (short-subunit alcohol dehydrogenase family)